MAGAFEQLMQARVASPSIWMVPAPHSATPQPYFVPVSPNSSRRHQSNGIEGLPSKDCSWPLTHLHHGVASQCGAAPGFYLRKSRPNNIVDHRTGLGDLAAQTRLDHARFTVATFFVASAAVAVMAPVAAAR